MHGEFEHLSERLESIAEELAELGLQQLREALESGTEPPDEKRLARARRSVLKAAELLRDRDGFD